MASFTTSRLTITPSPPVLSPFWPAFQSITSNPSVSSMGWGDSDPSPPDPSTIPLRAAFYEKSFLKRGYGMYAVSLSETDTYIGYVQLRNLDDMTLEFRESYERWFPREGEVEILYALAPEFWGKGYAKEMVKGILENTKKAEALRRVTACVMPGNAGSTKVLEGTGMIRCSENLGYSKEGDLYYVLER